MIECSVTRAVQELLTDCPSIRRLSGGLVGRLTVGTLGDLLWKGVWPWRYQHPLRSVLLLLPGWMPSRMFQEAGRT